MSDYDVPFVLKGEDKELVEWMKKRIIIKGYYYCVYYAK